MSKQKMSVREGEFEPRLSWDFKSSFPDSSNIVYHSMFA